MPTKPSNVTLTNSSADVLNVIRNNASVNYQNYVPIATNDADCIRSIGAIIMDYPNLQNEFLNALVNRIGKVLVLSKMYQNPISMFKQGILEMGESTEQIFVDLARPYDFDNDAENTLFKKEMPNVHSAFYTMNFQKMYKATVSEQQLKQAFLSVDGVNNLVTKIINALYTSANYDEFIVMKYMLARNILDGKLVTKVIPEVKTENMKSITSTIKEVSNELTFLSLNYNIAGVNSNALKNEQYILITSEFDAKMDVEVLASAFNMDKADFIGQRVLIDSFSNFDNTRLGYLFENDSNYKPITDDDIAILKNIPCVIVDKDFFMVYDNLITMKNVENQQGLYWNYFLHTWKTFAVSPFGNACVFNSNQNGTVTKIEMTPADSYAMKLGDKVQFSCDVTTTGGASKKVLYTTDIGTITDSGLLTIPTTETKATGTVTAYPYGKAPVTKGRSATPTATCEIAVIDSPNKPV